MSIDTELTRIEGAKADILGVIAEKGGVVPAGTKLEDIADILEEFPVVPSPYGYIYYTPQIISSWTSLTANIDTKWVAPYPYSVQIIDADKVKAFLTDVIDVPGKGITDYVDLVKNANSSNWTASWSGGSKTLTGYSLNLNEIGIGFNNSKANAVVSEKWGFRLTFTYTKAAVEEQAIKISNATEFNSLCMDFVLSSTAALKDVVIKGITLNSLNITGYEFGPQCENIGDNFLCNCFSMSHLAHTEYVKTVGNSFLKGTKYTGESLTFESLTSAGTNFMASALWYLGPTGELHLPELLTIGSEAFAYNQLSHSKSGWDSSRAYKGCVVDMPKIQTVGAGFMAGQTKWTQPTLDFSSALTIGYDCGERCPGFGGTIILGENTVVSGGLGINYDFFYAGGASSSSDIRDCTVIVRNTNDSPNFNRAFASMMTGVIKNVTVKGAGRQNWITKLNAQQYSQYINVIDGGAE